MPKPMKAAIPIGLDMKDGYVIRFTAIDPTTGALVAGVKVSNVTIQTDLLSGVATLPDSLSFELLPGPGT